MASKLLVINIEDTDENADWIKRLPGYDDVEVSEMAMELLKQERELHYGPGPHLGTGTPQSVHGRGRGKAPPTNSRFKEGVVRGKTFSARELDIVREDTRILPQSHLDTVRNLRQGVCIGNNRGGECSEYGYITLSQEEIGGKKSWESGTITHEVGHAVSFANRSHLDSFKAIYQEKQEALTIGKKWGVEVIIEAVQARQRVNGFPSWYSQVNPAELFAESYKMYVRSPKALQDRAPDLYSYMRDEIFDGVEYTE